MRKKKLRQKLLRAYGTVPEVRYEVGDLELCDLLGGAYDLYHFREYIEGDEMWFDYRLQPGKATSRNAINLLRLLGFEERLVKKAHTRANHYVETGIWE